MPQSAMAMPAPPSSRLNAMQEPTDAAGWLLAIATQADRRAFASLFRHFAPHVKAYLLRLNLPAARAEELTQETMLTIWRKAAQFDPASTGASAWIFTIARNLRVDEARRVRMALLNAEPQEAPPPAAGADAMLDIAERAARLREALAALPAEQAEVIRLSFFDDRPHPEIERALGIPLGTVKSRLRLAMARLRAVLGNLQ